MPLPLALVTVLTGFLLVLVCDRSFRLRSELARGLPLGTLGGIIVVFSLVGGAIALTAYHLHPAVFLSFPRRAPRLWLTIMALYPVLSVLPQELVYRTFFFHRYGPLFGGRQRLAILVNAMLFGFAHIIFANWIAVGGTFLAGLLFAFRYHATRSLWAVWLEHSLYGCLVFTVGLGRYFFTGISLPL